jgi:outer membrane protein OmpA-like peptidoglycan-associated protein
MRSRERQDHLASSFTDLMSSLVVIFILLFLAFVHEQEGRQESVKDKLLADLQHVLKDAQLDRKNIKKDGDSVVVIVPEGMTFDTGQSNLSNNGVAFLRTYIPPISRLLVTRFPNDVDSLVVEGYTDRQRRPGATDAEGESENLVLSQRRSMAVVVAALQDLQEPSYANERNFFLDRLSATGRGEQGASQEQVNDPASRRVIFRIRVRSTALHDAAEQIKADLKR